MKFGIINKAIIFSAFMGVTSNSNAAIVSINASFIASDFHGRFNSSSLSPVDTVTGVFEIRYDDASVSDLMEIPAAYIDIQVGDYSFNESNSSALLEIDTVTNAPTMFRVGGNEWGVNAGESGTNDMIFSYSLYDETSFFIFSLENEADIFVAETLITDYTISIVPVPAAIWLFGSGLIGLISFKRHKSVSI